jgi:hypothetical protein
MTAHVVITRLLTTGWLRWRAECSCGWQSASNSTRAVAERYGAGHLSLSSVLLGSGSPESP